MIAGLCITVWAIANIVALALCKAAAQGDEMPIEIGVSGSKSAGIADVAFPLDPPPPQPPAARALPLEDPNIDADAQRLLCWEHYCETG